MEGKETEEGDRKGRAALVIGGGEVISKGQCGMIGVVGGGSGGGCVGAGGGGEGGCSGDALSSNSNYFTIPLPFSHSTIYHLRIHSHGCFSVVFLSTEVINAPAYVDRTVRLHPFGA